MGDDDEEPASEAIKEKPSKNAVATARITRGDDGSETMTANAPQFASKDDDEDEDDGESEASLAKRALKNIESGKISEED